MTDREAEPSQRAAKTTAGVRRILREQYALHEARHHPAVSESGDRSRHVVPMAHTLADVYKCLHQGEFGVGHSIRDAAHFGEVLRREILLAEPSADSPILEDVSVDCFVFRVNLGPYRRRLAGDDNRAAALLLDACLESATIHRGEGRHFLALLNEFQRLNDGGDLSVEGMVIAFPAPMVDLFLREVSDFIARMGHIPVLSHSSVFRRYNAPSYRVVDRATLENSPLAFLLGETP